MTKTTTLQSTECQTNGCKEEANVLLEDYGLDGTLKGKLLICDNCLDVLCTSGECEDPFCPCGGSLPKGMKGKVCDH